MALQDTINIEWSVEDVKSIADDLTNHQCKRVLELAERNHDGNVGINWGVLEYWADIVRGN